MPGSSPEFTIVNQVARDIKQRLVRRTIRTLQAMNDPGTLLSGEDSGLKSVWEEVCVQYQGQHSMYWSLYVETLEGIVRKLLPNLQRYELEAIWLHTRGGRDWLDCDEHRREPLAIFEPDIVEFVADEVLGEAMNWSNPRIRAYLERQYLD